MPLPELRRTRSAPGTDVPASETTHRITTADADDPTVMVVDPVLTSESKNVPPDVIPV
jgi:hypothetical protein